MSFIDTRCEPDDEGLLVLPEDGVPLEDELLEEDGLYGAAADDEAEDEEVCAGTSRVRVPRVLNSASVGLRAYSLKVSENIVGFVRLTKLSKFAAFCKSRDTLYPAND